MHSNQIPCIFITHQLRVLTGKTSWISTSIHQYFIKKFQECWIPDYEKNPNFSGNLGHIENSNLNLKYIGTLSRFRKKKIPKKYDLMVLLSGPEPQRSILEKKLLTELKKFEGSILFIQGLIESEQRKNQRLHITTYNYMSTIELEDALNESNLILCRSGYTTIMDLAHLEKMAFFIPTPGQYEQEYLAQELDKKRLIPHCRQDEFKIEQLQRVLFYQGLKPTSNSNVLWKELFGPFQSKRKF